MRGHLRVLLVVVIVMCLMSGAANSQSQLFPGATVMGRIADDVGLAQYEFSASSGDLIRVRVMGAGGLDPALALVGTDGATLAGGTDDVWSPDTHDESIAFVAPFAGLYRVLVGGEDGSRGDYVLQFDLSTINASVLLPMGRTTVVPVSAATGSNLLRFATDPACPTTLVVQPTDGDEAGPFHYTVNLYDESGLEVAQLNPLWSAESRLTLQPGSHVYWADVVPMQGATDAQLMVTLSCVAAQPVCTEVASGVPVSMETGSVADDLLRVQVGRDLTYGQAVQGELGDGAPRLAYSFDGAAGDEVVLQVTGISMDFDPDLALLDPGLSMIGSTSDRTGAFRESDAVLSAVLPSTGRFTALVGSESGQPGVFVVRLTQGSAHAASTLDSRTDTPIDVGALRDSPGSVLRFDLTAMDECPTAVSVVDAGGQPLSVSVQLQHDDGTMIGVLRASSVESANWVLPAGSGAYQVLVAAPGDRTASGSPNLRTSCQMESYACTASRAQAPVALPTVVEPQPVPTATLIPRPDVVGIVAVSSANVRRGDSTAHGVIRALPRDIEVQIMALSASGSGWFKVVTPEGDEGWMSPTVLLVAADYAALPRANSPRAPAPQVVSSGGGNPTPSGNDMAAAPGGASGSSGSSGSGPQAPADGTTAQPPDSGTTAPPQEGTTPEPPGTDNCLILGTCVIFEPPIIYDPCFANPCLCGMCEIIQPPIFDPLPILPGR